MKGARRRYDDTKPVVSAFNCFTRRITFDNIQPRLNGVQPAKTYWTDARVQQWRNFDDLAFNA